MHALIVVSHPKPDSLTHAVAAHIAEGIASSGSAHTYEIADLAAEAFDPRFTSNDIDVHRRTDPPSHDITAEQRRLDRADALVLVYPVYWWSMPGLMKGWIDRVFANGWAYDEGPDGKTVKRLQRLQVHLVAIAGADQRTYARHGYFGAMKLQIDRGIFDYCGAQVKTSELLTSSDERTESHFAIAREIGRQLFSTRGIQSAA
jgi:NAD(P)H dehydrogenase (quinone)